MYKYNKNWQELLCYSHMYLLHTTHYTPHSTVLLSTDLRSLRHSCPRKFPRLRCTLCWWCRLPASRWCPRWCKHRWGTEQCWTEKILGEGKELLRSYNTIIIWILLVLLRASSPRADVRLRESERTARARRPAILISGNNQTNAGQLARTNGRSAAATIAGRCYHSRLINNNRMARQNINTTINTQCTYCARAGRYIHTILLHM